MVSRALSWLATAFEGEAGEPERIVDGRGTGGGSREGGIPKVVGTNIS